MYHDPELLLARRSLADLARLMGVTSTGERYIPTWFTTGVVCDALDRVAAHVRGKSWGIRRVMVKQPTQTGKSEHTEVLFPAGIVGRVPEARTLITGYGTEFMTRTLPGIRTVTQTAAWQAAYPDVFLGKLERGERGAADNLQRADVTRKRNGRLHKTGGFILARSVQGAVSGNPMDVGVFGDPYKDWSDALSAAINRQRRDFYTGVFARREQSRRTVQVVSFSPWTPNDVGNFILDQWEKDGEPYLVLSFPMFQRPDSRAELERWKKSPAMRAGLARFLRIDEEALNIIVSTEGLRPYDKRADGYPLLPFKDRDIEFYEQIRRSTPARDFAALCQMDPEASLFERFPKAHWRFFDPSKHRPERVILSIDPNGRATEDGSFAVIGVYSLEPVKLDASGRLADPDLTAIIGDQPALPWKVYRIDEFRARPNYSDLYGMIGNVLEKWPEARVLVLESKAAGQCLADDYPFQRLVVRYGVEVVLTNPRESKEVRQPRAEVPQRNGYCYLPSHGHGRITADWLHDDPLRLEDGTGLGFLSEMADFGVRWDDRPDEFSQAIAVLQEERTRDLLSGWTNLAQWA